MKCVMCDSEMKCREGKHHYTECGLDGVYLLGVDICDCPKCGENYVKIPLMPQLNTVIGMGLIKKKSLLNGKEIRYLRKNMGLKSKELAEYLGTVQETVSRWENNKQKIRKAHDRLIRMIYLGMKGMPTKEIIELVKNDFVEISAEDNSMPVYTIPREDWDKPKTKCAC